MSEKPESVLDKVLAYVDSPFKLFAAILMGVIAFSGYFQIVSIHRRNCYHVIAGRITVSYVKSVNIITLANRL